jgi:hypothetical protein
MSQRLIALILGTVLLSACAGLAPRSDSALPRAGEANNQFAIPFPQDRAASAITETHRTGIETDTRSDGAVELLARLELVAGPGGIEWATYAFTGLGANPLANATVNLGVPGSSGVYVGVANFTRTRWDFSEPHTGQAIMALTGDAQSPGGNAYIAVVVTNGGTAQIDQVSLGEVVPDPPVADLFTLTPQVNPLEAVNLDASSSTTTNGTIDNYEWDLDGNGIFNEPGAEESFAGNPLAALTMPAQPTAIDVAVRVTDSLGLTDEAPLTVTAIGWLIVNLATGSSVGDEVSLKAINGKPAIAYNVGLPPSLSYAYSTADDGSQGWTSLEVDTGFSVGRVDLAEINGLPAIAYVYDLPEDLKYAYSSAADGSSGWSSLPLNTAGLVQNHCGLAEVGGKPAVAAYVATGGSGGQVEYYYSSTDDGSSGWASSVVATGDTCGFGCNLGSISGLPAIVYTYYSFSVYYNTYSRNDMADGSGSWTHETVSTEIGQPHSLNIQELASGNPAMSFKGFNGSLFYARCTAPVGGTWSKIGLLSANTGTSNSLGLVNGKPALATQYSDFSLNFGRPDSVDGSGSWSFGPVATEMANGNATSVAEIDGRPAIAYRATTGGMFYATLFE